MPTSTYAYLLGIYLGDGTISRAAKGVWVLRILQDDRYPHIIGEIASAIAVVMPANHVRIDRKYNGWNCAHISCCSKSRPCLFPQHGPGMKHTRKIELAAWQWAYVWHEPGMFLRGLIHSDGCRVQNNVRAGTPTPATSSATSRSRSSSCSETRATSSASSTATTAATSISVARRASVALLDEIVGPKT